MRCKGIQDHISVLASRVKESGSARFDHQPVRLPTCAKAGIPTEFVELAWDKFRRRYLDDANARGSGTSTGGAFSRTPWRTTGSSSGVSAMTWRV